MKLKLLLGNIMLTIKYTQPSGAISIIESKTVCVLIPKTEAWDEFKTENTDIITDNMRGIVMYDGGTICVFTEDTHLYIVNENGKTVQTV